MTAKAARAALAVEIAAEVADSSVTVLGYDPPTISGKTVSVSTAGLLPTEYRLFLRVYVPAAQSAEGQDALDDLTELVEAAPISAVPRGAWEFVYDDGKDAFVMFTTVDYPREDF